MSDDDPALVVATLPDGSVIQRYVKSGEYWQVKPDGLMYPGQHLSMKRAALRVAYNDGTVVPGVAAARRFYAAVERARVEWLAERAAQAD